MCVHHTCTRDYTLLCATSQRGVPYCSITTSPSLTSFLIAGRPRPFIAIRLLDVSPLG